MWPRGRQTGPAGRLTGERVTGSGACTGARERGYPRSVVARLPGLDLKRSPGGMLGGKGSHPPGILLGLSDTGLGDAVVMTGLPLQRPGLDPPGQGLTPPETSCNLDPASQLFLEPVPSPRKSPELVSLGTEAAAGPEPGVWARSRGYSLDGVSRPPPASLPFEGRWTGSPHTRRDRRCWPGQRGLAAVADDPAPSQRARTPCLASGVVRGGGNLGGKSPS